jgi:hypothetical protein
MKLEDAIRSLVLNALTEILQPLLDKWDKDIEEAHDLALYAGLITARKDVQDIIDRARERKH